jgi:hypothetical protein
MIHDLLSNFGDCVWSESWSFTSFELSICSLNKNARNWWLVRRFVFVGIIAFSLWCNSRPFKSTARFRTFW